MLHLTEQTVKRCLRPVLAAHRCNCSRECQNFIDIDKAYQNYCALSALPAEVQDFVLHDNLANTSQVAGRKDGRGVMSKWEGNSCRGHRLRLRRQSTPLKLAG